MHFLCACPAYATAKAAYLAQLTQINHGLSHTVEHLSADEFVRFVFDPSHELHAGKSFKHGIWLLNHMRTRRAVMLEDF